MALFYGTQNNNPSSKKKIKLIKPLKTKSFGDIYIKEVVEMIHTC